MKNKELFKQAILDAKAIRETAMHNAKSALEEQLTPRLQALLAKRLQEQEEKELSETTITPKGAEITPAAKIKSTGLGSQAKIEVNENDNLDEELDLDEILAELEGQELNENQDLEEGDDDENTDEPEAEPATDTDAPPAADFGGEGDVVSDEDKISTLDVAALKNILRDIIAQEIAGGEGVPGEGDLDGSLDTPDAGVDDQTGSDPFATGDDEFDSGMTMAGEDEDDDINLDELLAELENVNNEGLGTAVKSGINKVGSAIKKGAQSVAKGLDDVNPKHFKPGGKHYGNHSILPTNETTELNEAIRTINTLRRELNEVNLLNAKLLYVNKIFKAKNLTESQKVKVITTFDKVSSAKDAKLVYEALEGSLTAKAGVTKKPIYESRGYASKPAGVAPKASNNIVDDNTSRWQYLAGIKKNKY